MFSNKSIQILIILINTDKYIKLIKPYIDYINISLAKIVCKVKMMSLY